MSNQERILILDNGGYTCKVGWSTDSTPKSIANYAVRPKRDTRIFIADEVAEVTDTSGMFFRRPSDKGVVLNWDLQGQIYRRIMNVMEGNPKDTNVMLLETPFSLQENLCHEVLFETIGFHGLHRCMSSVHAVHGYRYQNPQHASHLPCSLVIDSGYSYTHIIPVYNGMPIREAVVRINVGGRHITNLLKHTLSTRYFDLSSETQLVNEIKEQLVFASLDFDKDLAISQETTPGLNTLRREYILPDFLTTFRGKIREPVSLSILQEPIEEPAIPLTNERFSSVELLFRPVDYGLNQAGLGEAVIECLKKCPEELAGPLLSNIICCGGNFAIPQLADRLYLEIRTLAPIELPVRVHVSNDPINTNWYGAQQVINAYGDNFSSVCITKAEWDDMGKSAVARKFTGL